MALDDRTFAALADRTLNRVLAAVEAAEPDADGELRDGILTLEIDEIGTFVINKHGPNREVWLSSPRSGAWHFAWDEGAVTWRSTRGLETLVEVLERDLGQALGQKVALG